MFQQTNEGITIKFKVVPKSSKNSLAGWENGEMKIRLAAVPEKGAANEALIRFLAEILDIGKSSIRIIQGETSRHKRVCITGLSIDQIKDKLQKHFKETS
jgi:uncharacterized protein (TIGR00251 family)